MSTHQPEQSCPGKKFLRMISTFCEVSCSHEHKNRNIHSLLAYTAQLKTNKNTANWLQGCEATILMCCDSLCVKYLLMQPFNVMSQHSMVTRGTWAITRIIPITTILREWHILVRKDIRLMKANQLMSTGLLLANMKGHFLIWVGVAKVGKWTLS